MRLVILSPNPPDCMAFGPRQLASVLKAGGHQVSVVFLRGGVGANRFDGEHVYQYPEAVVRDVVEICRGADAVGVSFMSLYWDRAVQLTEAVQRALGLPVIWGGTHPTVRPETSIQIADYVCVGEGEIAVPQWLEALHGGDPTAVRGVWARVGARVIDNGEAPDLPDLNAIPWPDFDTPGHYVDHRGRVVPMTSARMREVLPRLPFHGGRQAIGMRVMATRGCPHRCTYCASSAQRPMRRRTVESTVAQMRWLKERYPFIEVFYEFDDTFFANSYRWMEEFAAAYKREVGLPWFCQTSPTTLREDKLDLLLDAGLIYCEMGIQSGSEEIKELFLRSETEDQVRAAASLLHRHHTAGRMLRPRYHVITDVPWESADSVRMTLSLLLSLEHPFDLAIGSLVLFPGTWLNEKATAEGLLTDEVRQIYRKPFLHPVPSWLNWLIYAAGQPWIPRPLLRALAQLPANTPLLGGDGLRPTPFTRALHRSSRAAERLPRAMQAVRNRELERILRALTQVR
ncbi:MAG: B12-binding domain-containing radical SAM protein [Deltaproteobacteria bacterium]|nr:B12-binding domain-containing radical SAM protein [Deltaproteobacteria bacterium]